MADAPKKSRMQDYFERVADGSVVACKKMRLLASIILRNLANPGRYHFDIDRAERACDFIESYCKAPSGRLGKPLVLGDFQAAFVQCIFGFVDDAGYRQYNEVLMVIARKNGKTTLAAAIELYLLVGDGEGAPQIYNVATNHDQAMLGFNACHKMVKQSKLIAKRVGYAYGKLNCGFNMGYIEALSSKTETKDGLDVHGAIIDELAAIRNRDLYDLIKQGMSAREQPLLLEITTNGFVRNGIFDAQYEYASKWLEGKIEDEHFLPFIYELDDREEWTDEACWVKANPGLGTIKKVDALRSNVQKAMNDPDFRPTLMVKDFNVPENASVAWLTFEEAINEERYDIREKKFRYGICGFDLSATTDLTCAQMMMMEQGSDKIYVHSMYWIPEEAVVANDMSGSRVERDGAPYAKWISRGLMRTVPGNKINKEVLIDWLEEMRNEYDVYTYAIGYDPWGIANDDNFRTRLEAFVGKQRCIPVRQGAQTLSAPMKQLRADYRANRIVDNHNPINEWCRMNVCIKVDENNNIKPVKKLSDERNRIDGFAAEIDAYVVLNSLYDEYLQIC